MANLAETLSDEKGELREEVRIKKEETGNRSGGKKVEGRIRKAATKSQKEELRGGSERSD